MNLKKKLFVKAVCIATVWAFVFSVCATADVPALSVSLSAGGGSNTPVFGPSSGSLEHKDDDLIKTYSAGVSVRNFIAEATFYNPYSTTKGKWDYGFLFRYPEVGTFYTIEVRSDGKWYYSIRIEGESNTTGEGKVSGLRTGVNQSNHLRIIIIGDCGAFYVNDQFVTVLDTSTLTEKGNIKAAIGMTNGYEIEGEATRFKDFTVWSLDTPTAGPSSGSLEHDDDGYIEEYRAGVNVNDFVAEATFYNPYSTTKGKWDYGFIFRRPKRNTCQVIRVASDGKWKHNVVIDGDWNSLEEGRVSGLRTGANQSNHLRIIIFGDSGEFYVNGTFVATLDTSGLAKSGDIRAASGIHNAYSIEGEATRFKDFTVWSLDGCSVSPLDRDRDGVRDDRDSCYNPECSTVDSRGCPKDSDSDGVLDCDDRCINEKGPASNRGCPGDKDNDGVKDNYDRCYNPGCRTVDTVGCPKDSDSDGVNDCEDECPTEYGEPDYNGCPDTDNDGITDHQDNCYNPECSTVDSRGCPKDSDSDGVTDCEDECVHEEGPLSNMGCPVPPLMNILTYWWVIAVLICALGGIFYLNYKHSSKLEM